MGPMVADLSVRGDRSDGGVRSLMFLENGLGQ